MKKVFANFTWKMFWSYAIIFGGLSVLFDVVLKKFSEPDFVLKKYLIGLIVKIILFSLFMSLLNNSSRKKNQS